MRLSGIIPESVVDGPGVRFVIFTQGCPHHCPGCHNPETWDPSGGKEMTLKEIVKLIKRKAKNIKGITLSGGDPFLQACEAAALAREAKKMGLDVVTYTGYTYEELLGINGSGFQELLEVTDILVDGPFLIQYRDIGLAYRGSSNQRVIDLSATRAKGSLVLIA